MYIRPMVRTFSFMSFGNTELTAYGVELRTTIMPRRDAIVPNGVYLYDKLKVIGMTESGGAVVEELDEHRGNLWGFV